MKIVFNTKEPTSPAFQFYSHAFFKLPDIVFSDWENYKNYEVVLFMQNIETIKEIDKARQVNPQLKIGIVDPRESISLPYVKKSDFLIVNSLE